MALAPSVCHVGFFTLTTPDNCSDHHEFRQRWRSFNSHYFSQSPHFGHWLATYERQRRVPGIFVLVLLPYDIRTGVDFTQFALGRYSSAPPYLRAVWRELRIKCKAYGLAVTNCYPSKAMQMQWLNILASIFQNIWDPEKMRIKVKAHCFFFRLDKKQHSFSWFNDNSIFVAY